MKAYSLTREERETILNRSEAETTWNLYTSSPAVMRRLDKWAKATEVGRMEGRIVSKTYDLPKACISIHRPRKVTNGVRAASVLRMKKMAMEQKAARGTPGEEPGGPS
jgi:hypothetical protein